MKKLQILLSILVIPSMVLINSCKKEEGTSGDSLKDVITNAGIFEDPVDEQKTTEAQTYETEDDEGVQWECTTATYEMNAGASGNEPFIQGYRQHA